jgi:acetyltransferase-like isoleucine patch superfamily enzyme
MLVNRVQPETGRVHHRKTTGLDVARVYSNFLPCGCLFIVVNQGCMNLNILYVNPISWAGKLKYRILHNRRIKTLKKAAIGENSYVDPSCQILGWEHVRIGSQSTIGQDSWININHRRDAAQRLIIGDRCFIGRRNFFTTGTLIQIGNYCLTGPDCHFLGSDHIYTSPFRPYCNTGTTDGGNISLGANCWLGSGVVVLKGVTIGYGSIIGAAAVVNKDVPPFSIVVGNPGRVIKRFDLQSNAWVPIKDYPVDGDAHLPSEQEYLETLNQVDFVKPDPIASSQILGDL